MAKNKKPRALVLGSAGFIGSHLCDRLLSLGWDVTGIDDLSSGNNLNDKISFHKANISNNKEMSRILDLEDELPDIVFHLAANTNVPLSVDKPLEDFKSVEGSLRIIEWCTLYSTPIIYVSSSFVYGNTENLPTKETEPFNLSAPYGITKHIIEQYLMFYGGVYDLDYVIVRPSTVYGPRQIHGAMADYIKKLKSGKQSTIYGYKTRDYIYIDDLIDALVLLIDGAEDIIYNVGTGKQTSLGELYKTIAAMVGAKCEWIFEGQREGEIVEQQLNCKRLRKLGWKPKVGLKEGLKLTV